MCGSDKKNLGPTGFRTVYLFSTVFVPDFFLTDKKKLVLYSLYKYMCDVCTVYKYICLLAPNRGRTIASRSWLAIQILLYLVYTTSMYSFLRLHTDKNTAPVYIYSFLRLHTVSHCSHIFLYFYPSMYSFLRLHTAKKILSIYVFIPPPTHCMLKILPQYICIHIFISIYICIHCIHCIHIFLYLPYTVEKSMWRKFSSNRGNW